MLRLAPVLTFFLFIAPVAAGFAGAVVPAFGFFPALGGSTFSLDPWRDLANYPGVFDATVLSLVSGVISTLISLAITIFFAAAWRRTKWFIALQRLLAPLLSIPHAAVALGIIFLLAPSGWIMRIVSPWATGFERPPDLALAPDPYGLVLILCLVVKETPFLFLMMTSALNQTPDEKLSTTATTLGYQQAIGWLKSAAPQVLRQMRLPILAVLAYSVSVVDVALVLTSATKPTLSVLVLRWFNDPDLTFQFVAAAGACLQTLLVILAGSIWIFGEKITVFLFKLWVAGGNRSAGETTLTVASFGAVSIVVLFGLGTIFVTLLWSIARRWRFPDFLPERTTTTYWTNKVDALIDPTVLTINLAAGSAIIALVLAILCFEFETTSKRKLEGKVLWILYLPLLAPQVAFLFGIQVLLAALGADGHWMALLWSHLIFVGPYVFLSLSGAYRQLDDRYRFTATSLGTPPIQAFLRVTAPLLLRPLLIAFAVGIAVSVGQYLPTVFAGAGRFDTLTTEAITLASGGDRRIVAMLAFAQSMIPLVCFVLAAAIPSLVFHGKQELASGR